MAVNIFNIYWYQANYFTNIELDAIIHIEHGFAFDIGTLTGNYFNNTINTIRNTTYNYYYIIYVLNTNRIIIKYWFGNTENYTSILYLVATIFFLSLLYCHSGFLSRFLTFTTLFLSPSLAQCPHMWQY